MTDGEIEAEMQRAHLEFLLEDWGVSEGKLYARLSLPGRDPVCDFGAGAQGIAFMTEDGGFLKVTDSAAEAAFALVIRDERLVEFPLVHDVYAFEIGGNQLYAIYREAADDYLGPFTDEKLDDLVHCAMEGAARTFPPSFEAMERLRQESPKHHAELTSLLAALDDLHLQAGLGVSDLHSENIGRTDDGRVVVRDFGMNTLPPAEVDRLLRRLPSLPNNDSYQLA